MKDLNILTRRFTPYSDFEHLLNAAEAGQYAFKPTLVTGEDGIYLHNKINQWRNKDFSKEKELQLRLALNVSVQNEAADRWLKEIMSVTEDVTKINPCMHCPYPIKENCDSGCIRFKAWQRVSKFCANTQCHHG